MKRITLVGFGLLASSVAAAIKQAGLPTVIRAVSSDNTLKMAKDMGLADEFFHYDETEKWAADNDLILLCTPILHILKTLDSLKNVSWAGNATEKKILVSDIGSTKVEICKAGSQLPAAFRFVGSHPMAGSEKRTLENNDPSIFENAYWFVCPPAGVAEEEYAPLLELIHFVGASPVVFPPEHHDQTMAWVSHMPQMLSSTLAANMPERLRSNNYQHYAGRAFRDMTRIAASGWGMWHDIAVTNSVETTRALKEVRDGLNQTIEAMESVTADSGNLEKIFKAGNEGRVSLFAPGRNAAAAFYEITVPLKDEPGALLNVMKPLADAGINIRDIELMKVRENVAGTLLLAFKKEEEVKAAVKMLQGLGYDVKER